MAKVVIVGAGFGGLWAAKGLAKSGLDVTIVDRHNYHLFTPLLYQVAAAEIEPEAIAYPVRKALRGPRFVMANVTAIDRERKAVLTDSLELPYDYLVLALGSQTAYFGVPGAQEHSYPLKSLADAIRLRNQVLTCFEHASLRPEEADRLLSFVVIGGGPTGIEYSGALSELINRPLARDFPALKGAKVVLVERVGLLGGLPPKLGEYAGLRLKSMGVDVRLGVAVEEVTSDGVKLSEGVSIVSSTVIWTAGVAADPSAAKWGLPTGKQGRVEVDEALRVSPGVYAIGDLAAGSPMIAPPATQAGSHAAKNILREVRGEQPLPFRYKDPGMMATIGRNAAVVSIKNINLTGFPAWLMWLVVHVAKLIGFRNRLLVLLGWAWDYVSFEKSVRLILPAVAERSDGPSVVDMEHSG